MSTFASSVAEHLARLRDGGLAVGPPLGDHLLDLGVLARVQDLERAVLELPLDRVDAEAVGERRVDLERLLRLADLGLLALVLDRAHVVEPVGELDQDDADVLRHRDDHLPVVLGVRLLAGLEGGPGQLRDALDQLGDLVAELGADLVELGLGVLDDVVQEGGGERLLVEMELGADLRDRPRMVDERLAGAAGLAFVRGRGEVERAREEILVDAGVVRLDGSNQLIDEVLVVTFGVDDSHEASVLRPPAGESPPQECPLGQRTHASHALFTPPPRAQGRPRRPPPRRSGRGRRVAPGSRPAPKPRLAELRAGLLGRARQLDRRLGQQRPERRRLVELAPGAVGELELREDLARVAPSRPPRPPSRASRGCSRSSS